MTETEKAVWLTERKKGVGGSDIASVFSVGYGCKLRLWRDKRDEVPDYPREHNEAQELGTFLEPYFAEKYRQKTGRRVDEHLRPHVHPKYPMLRVNVDRLIDDPARREAGVLEIKSVGRDVFYKVKREGLPEDYVLQLQHAMLVVGTDWGSFCVGDRNSGAVLWWDVERNTDLSEMIVAHAQAFWRDIATGTMPDRLEPDDSRCQKCEYRRSCQGAALMQIEPYEGAKRDDTLLPLLNEYLERKSLLEQAELLVDESKEELKTTLGNRTEVTVGAHPVYYRPQVAMRGNFKAIAEFYDKLRKWALNAIEAHPDLAPKAHKLEDEYLPAASYREPSQSRPFRVF